MSVTPTLHSLAETLCTTWAKDKTQNGLPLLIKGSAGTGKSTLAKYIAAKILAAEAIEQRYALHYIDCYNEEWELNDIKSVVRDLALYTQKHSIVLLIDHLDAGTRHLHNHLLKFCEELPARLYLIVTATKTANMPATLLSRFWVQNTPPASNADIRYIFGEQLDALPSAIQEVVIATCGGSLGKLQQVLTLLPWLESLWTPESQNTNVVSTNIVNTNVITTEFIAQLLQELKTPSKDTANATSGASNKVSAKKATNTTANTTIQSKGVPAHENNSALDVSKGSSTNSIINAARKIELKSEILLYCLLKNVSNLWHNKEFTAITLPLNLLSEFSYWMRAKSKLPLYANAVVMHTAQLAKAK